MTLLKLNQVIEQRLVSSAIPLRMRNLKVFDWVYHNKTEIIQDWRKLQYAAIDRSVNKDTSIAVADKPKQKTLLKENFDVKISPSSFGSFELMMCVSTSMVVALMVFVWNMKRT